MSEWIKCSERLPEIARTRYLVLLDGIQRIAEYDFSLSGEAGFWRAREESHGINRRFYPTHWMPLPEPPAVLEKLLKGER